MSMNVKEISKGRALYVDKGIIWIAKGLDFYGIDHEGRRITRKYKMCDYLSRLIATLRLPRQLLRVGIHHLLPLKENRYLVSLKKKIIIVDIDGSIISTFTGYRGNKPAHRGICITPDGTLFFGEYTVNINNDNPTSLYRSTDGGMSFQNIYTFSNDEVRHIHFIEWDEYENCIWMGTGDKDCECKLLRSEDNGESWDLIGHGSQLWRAIGVSFTKDALFWGTDAGSVPDPNFIIMMDRKTRQIEKVKEVHGPCHGNAVLLDDTVYVSTGIEGGENEKDRYAHVWECNRYGIVNEILKYKKDNFPHIVQYGVIRFPMGIEKSSELVFTTYALANMQENVFVLKQSS